MMRPLAFTRIIVAVLVTASLFAAPVMAQRTAAPELTPEASAAIDKGLQYLLRTQRDDGSWASGQNDERAVALTSLALMAFMSRAEFPGFGPNGEALNRAKDWLDHDKNELPRGVALVERPQLFRDQYNLYPNRDLFVLRREELDRNLREPDRFRTSVKSTLPERPLEEARC